MSPAYGWRSQLYPEDWVPPTDALKFETDKIIQDFSYAGYKRGESPIPTITGPVFNVVTSYGADPTGIANSTAAIQNAINAAQNAGGGVVYLPPGTYRVTRQMSGNYCLLISRPNVVLRGAGAGVTFIMNATTEMRERSVIRVMRDTGAWNSNEVPIDGGKLRRDVLGPTRMIPVESTQGFKVGDWVIVKMDVTSEFIAEHQMSDLWNAETHGPNMGGVMFQRQIKAIHEHAQILELDAPVRYYLKVRDNARVFMAPRHLEGVGLEDFSIGNIQNSGTGWEDGDYNVSGKGAYLAHGAYLIRGDRLRNAWVRGVKSYQPSGNTTGTHTLSCGIAIQHSVMVTIDNCNFQASQYGGAGGNGYMYRLQNSADILIKDSSAGRSRHGYVIVGMQSTGNVIHNSLTHDTGMQLMAPTKTGGLSSDHHQHLSVSNLIDASRANKDLFEARYRGTSGGNHGQTSAHTVFWNIEGISYYSGRNYVVHSDQARYGYIIGTRGTASGASVSMSAPSRTSPEDHAEGIGQGNTLVPLSLYQDQLQRRLSPEVTERPQLGVGRDITVALPHAIASLQVAVGTKRANEDYTLTWELESGPAAVYIRPEGRQQAMAQFDEPGVYRIRVTATNSVGSVSDVITVIVLSRQPVALGSVLADTTARDGARAGQNYGTEPTLRVGRGSGEGVSEAWLRFDLASMPAEPLSGGVRLAVLNRTGDSPVQHTLYVAPDAWTENELTWNGRPALTETPVAQWIPGAVGSEEYISLPATLLRQVWKAKKPLNLVIRAESGGPDGHVLYGSREHTDISVRPDLILSLGAGAGDLSKRNPVGVFASGAQDGNPETHLIDNDLSTRWSQEGEGEWAYLDLGETVLLAGADIAFYQGTQRTSTFDLEVSSDAETWVRVLTGAVSSGQSLLPQRFLFTPISGRYLRYVGYGNSVNLWNSVTELVALKQEGASRVVHDVPVAWVQAHFGENSVPLDLDPDQNGFNRWQEYVTGLTPDGGESVQLLRLGSDSQASFFAKGAMGTGYAGYARYYQVEYSQTLKPGSWEALPGVGPIMGLNREVSIELPQPATGMPMFYRLSSWLESPDSE